MPTCPQAPPSCAAIITAYQPGESLVTAVESVLPAVDQVVVVDDGSPDGPASEILDAVRERGATVVRHAENLGIGAALDTGLDVLAHREAGTPGHVLTLDQDSVLPPGAIELYLDAERAATAAGVRVGMIAPGSAESVTRLRPHTADAEFRLGTEPIQSGLLIPWRALESIGPFAADLFIDGVDSDFYLRALALGYRCIEAPRVRISHRLDRAYSVHVGGRGLDLTVAQDFRYYYQVRNLVHLARRHGLRHPVWTAGAALREARHLGIVTALVPGRTARLREARRGLADGLRGMTGRRPEHAPAARAVPGRAGDARVSVCLAAYNGERYIAEQIASILPQLSTQDEIVVVDDCSTDGTAAAVRNIDDPRVRLVTAARNQGYVRTFAQALSLAHGDYLLLSDQDDVWLPGHVDGLVGALRTHDVAASNLTTLGGPDTIRGPYGQADWRLRAADSRHHLRNIGGVLAGNRPYYGCAMGIHREALARGAAPFPAFLNESHDLWLALYGNVNGSIAHLEDRTLARRYHEDNQTPNHPRGPLAVLRSRILLVRCLAVLTTRRLARMRVPRTRTPQSRGGRA